MYRLFGVSTANSNCTGELFTYVGSGNLSNAMRWYIQGNIGNTLLANGSYGVGTTAPRSGFQSNAATSGIIGLDVSGQVFGRLPVRTVSGTSLDLSANFVAFANTYFYITATNFASIVLPGSTATTQGGQFYQVKNSTGTSLNVTLADQLGLGSPVIIPPFNAITLVVSPNTSNTMLLF
jgi:hypothetical protein